MAKLVMLFTLKRVKEDTCVGKRAVVKCAQKNVNPPLGNELKCEEKENKLII